jgi:hypothetical protein
LKIKFADSRVNVYILASTSVSFTLTTVQEPNLALTRTKRTVVDPDALIMHRRGLPGPDADPRELRWFPGSPPHRNAQGSAHAGHYLAPNQVKIVLVLFLICFLRFSSQTTLLYCMMKTVRMSVGNFLSKACFIDGKPIVKK